ncbi:hypothetical protein Glove_33g278 [Diversispora epigaea]|uniref:BTB domain-containing protein n=1 Tax=Diversispora epigaea TaxID=1348612 RepID=A0A397JLB7_9GLOM|nr:hypothetical protein Glove_33g278 [Diversispora epigaea]
MSLKFFGKLSQNFVELLNDKDDYNVIVEVENKEKSFTAHSNVLKYRSSYFRQELENIQPNAKNIKIITKPSISSKIFEVILKYIYGGIVNLEKVETRFIFDLMLIANEFELVELSSKLETILIKDKASWLKTHFSLVYRTIFVKENFRDLENFCNDIVVEYPNLIFDSSDFTSIPESALVSLIKQDDLQMREVEIWDYVIKWGIAQNPTLPTNLGDWAEENFLTLKTTLQQCLPHIRYFHITNIEIYDKIRPYKKILDKQLWEDVKQHLVAPYRSIKSNILPARSVLNTELPPRTNEPFSTIISEDHVAEISSWIDRKTISYSTTNIPYKFELILSGTRNGFAPKTFWNFCHGLACTIVVAKVKGTDEIIGGYNPLTWNNTYNRSQWMETKDSFIFSLKNGNIQNSILSRVKVTKNAILNVGKNNQNFQGPYFGFGFSLRSEKSRFNLDYVSRCDNTLNCYEKHHVAEISSWIDRKTISYSTTNIPYKFELILSGTRNGFAPKTFWNFCHGLACTIVVAKVKGTDEIIGGYNPLTWNNTYNRSQWMETKDSFIFSLKNGNIQNSILSRVKVTKNAILNVGKNNQNFQGPYFGFGFSLRSEKSRFNLDYVSRCDNTLNCYEKRVKTSSEIFSIDNYEVFKVIRKF